MMNENRRGKGWGFRVVLILLLLGIFVELSAIVHFLSDGDSRRGNIAVVEIRGEILDSLETVTLLKDFAKNDEVKAIILRVDSPGGTVGASQEIHDAVKEINRKKKIVVSMGDLAASGGYYVSAPAAKIVANPGTITGSIGVIAHFLIMEDLLKRAYIGWEVIKAGEVKDMGSPFRRMTDKERKIMQSLTDDMHDQFITAVAEGRNMPKEKVKALADGRVISGRQAMAAGLVDMLGGMERAVKIAAELGHVEGEPKLILPEREKFGWFKRLAEGKWGASGLKIGYLLSP